MSVTVITTTGVTYLVADGVDFAYQTGPTGELVATVFGQPAAASTDSPELAAFGNVEAAYLDASVVVVSQPPAQSRGLL